MQLLNDRLIYNLRVGWNFIPLSPRPTRLMPGSHVVSLNPIEFAAPGLYSQFSSAMVSPFSTHCGESRPDELGETPLFEAAARGDASLAAALLLAKADASRKSLGGMRQHHRRRLRRVNAAPP